MVFIREGRTNNKTKSERRNIDSLFIVNFFHLAVSFGNDPRVNGGYFIEKEAMNTTTLFSNCVMLSRINEPTFAL